MTGVQTDTPRPPAAPPDLTTLDGLFAAGVGIAGLALLAGVLAAVVAFVYRWYVRESIPEGIAVLVGTAAVAVWLNALSGLQAVIDGDMTLLDPETAIYTIAALVAGAIAADVGRRLGDRFGERTGRVAAVRELGEMGQIVRSGGRAVTIDLPDDAGDIGDIDGYDPSPEEVKTDLAGRSFVFPRGLTVAELRDRLVTRLREDHGVGHVDVELDPDGTITYLAIGSRAAGIGTTLGPGTTAVAVRANPPNNASPGDTVQVWRGGEDPERIAAAEFRGGAGDVVTLALDAADAERLDGETTYRLVTLPRRPAAEREFASLLQVADETMGAVTVAEESQLVGLPLGALDVTVAAVRGSDGVDPIPTRSRLVAAGETLYVVARPDELRRFEAAARPPEDAGDPDATEQAVPSDDDD